MTVFAGHYGNIELKRVGSSNELLLRIGPEDLDITRKRISLSTPSGQDIAFGTITTGDRVRITTTDSRGLPFRFYEDAANSNFIDNPGPSILPLEFYANVDAIGAIRMYRTFADAVANSGEAYLAIPIAQSATAAPWPVTVSLLPGDFNVLGEVQGFTLSTNRETADTTSLGDNYRDFSSTGISGSGSVDCLFSFKNVENEEMPVALSELIQKVEIGSRFQGKFYILEPFNTPRPRGYEFEDGVYYEVDGIFTESSITVRSDRVVEASFNFVTAGEFKLKTGVSPTDLATENLVSIGNDATLESLGVLQEAN